MFNFIFCCSETDPKPEPNEKNFTNTEPEQSFRKTSSRKHGGRSQTADAYGWIKDRSTTASKKPITMVDESRLTAKANIVGIGRVTKPNSGQISQVESFLQNRKSTFEQSQDRQARRENNDYSDARIRPLVIEGANDLAFQRNPSIFIVP